MTYMYGRGHHRLTLGWTPVLRVTTRGRVSWVTGRRALVSGRRALVSGRRALVSRRRRAVSGRRGLGSPCRLTLWGTRVLSLWSTLWVTGVSAGVPVRRGLIHVLFIYPDVRCLNSICTLP